MLFTLDCTTGLLPKWPAKNNILNCKNNLPLTKPDEDQNKQLIVSSAKCLELILFFFSDSLDQTANTKAAVFFKLRRFDRCLFLLDKCIVLSCVFMITISLLLA